MSEKQHWRTYEEVARFLLDKIKEEFGLARVEGKQVVPGLGSGTKWEIDAKGVTADEAVFVLVEIRRYTARRLSQEDVGAIAYRIQDMGSKGGIVVSPLPLQEGAKKVAKAEDIVEVQLDEHSTTKKYLLRFLKKVMYGDISEAVVMGPDSIIGASITSVKQKP